MTGSDPAPITAALLRARPEWQRGLPNPKLVYEEMADEGEGIGFDNLDPSAMARVWLQTPLPWSDVLSWYRELLSGLGWTSRVVRDDWWWEWTRESSPREPFILMDRGRTAIVGSPVPDPGTTLYELMFTARGASPTSRHADA